MAAEPTDRIRDLEKLVRDLDRAMLGHVQWLDAWHRNLVCEGPRRTSTPSPGGPYCHCQFGEWLERQSPERIADHPSLARLDELHRSMHEEARGLAREWQEHRRINPEHYDAFLEIERQFARALLHLDGEAHEHLSAFDSLTGVMNRRAFVRVLAQEQARVNRSGDPCCLAIVDLDGFKAVNDAHGHPVGDKVLRAVARYLTDNLRSYDSISRYGGDEFLLVLPNTPLLAARSILDRLRAGIAEITVERDANCVIHPRASIGVALLASNTSIKQAVANADKALYEAKKRGGNQLGAWSPDGGMAAKG